MARKPTLYLDTNIISTLHYSGKIGFVIARQLRTREWRENERKYYDLWTSRFTEDELEAGKYDGQEEALREVRRLKFISVHRSTIDLARELVLKEIVPIEKDNDAFHLACAIEDEVDWLLTWNQAHLENPHVQRRLSDFSANMQLRVPLVKSPNSIPWVNLGQTIRRD